jgi:hypothetical protein
METKRFVNARELCVVLENLEKRIQILRELFCGMGDLPLEVQETLVTDVEALTVNSQSVSGTGCKPK